MPLTEQERAKVGWVKALIELIEREGPTPTYRLFDVRDVEALTAIIDRLAGEQEPAKCKYCSESSPYLAVIEAADPRVFVSVSGAYLQVFDEEYPGFVDNIPICYCPKCGRKLTDRKEPDDG